MRIKTKMQELWYKGDLDNVMCGWCGRQNCEIKEVFYLHPFTLNTISFSSRNNVNWYVVLEIVLCTVSSFFEIMLLLLYMSLRKEALKG